MNPTIITIIISIASLIFLIIGSLQFYAARMEKILDSQINGLRGVLDSQISGLRGETREGFAALRAEIQTNRVEIQAVSARVERIERQLDSIMKPSLPPGRGD